MKKLISVIMLTFISLVFSGCYRGPYPDAALNWFDVTEYKQELFDMCYGDGYVNRIPGDPGYCPAYTQEELDTKLELYLSEYDLIYIKDVGINYIHQTIDNLETDFKSLITDEEVLRRVNGVEFYTCIAEDAYGQEKIVYLPSYVPKESTKYAYIYDLPELYSYKRFEQIILDQENSYHLFNAVSSNGTLITQMKVLINNYMMNDVLLTRGTTLFYGELVYQVSLDTYALEENQWVRADNFHYGFWTGYVRFIDNKMTISIFTGWDDNNQAIIDTVFETEELI